MTQVRTTNFGCGLEIPSWLVRSSSTGHHHDMNQVSVAVHDLFFRGLGGVVHAICMSSALILLWEHVSELRDLWHVPNTVRYGRLQRAGFALTCKFGSVVEG